MKKICATMLIFSTTKNPQLFNYSHTQSSGHGENHDLHFPVSSPVEVVFPL